MVEELQLTVAPFLKQENVGKNIAGINQDTMNKLEVSEGDIVEIFPEKPKKISGDEFVSEKTPAIVRNSNKIGEGSNPNIVRLDRFKREDIRTLIQEKVKVKKANVKEAKETKLIPLEVSGTIENKVKPYSIVGTPVIEEGYITSIKIDQDEWNSVSYLIVETKPKGTVLITKNTNIRTPEKGK